MMKTVIVEIPRGYAPQVEAAISSRPALDPIAAVREFVCAKYGAWITANCAAGFEIEMRSDREFTVLFDEEEDAAAFVHHVGGRIAE